MAKVLVIRKPDRSIHQTLLSNSAAMKAFSNRLPKDKQWKFEVMEEEEAKKLPSIDPNYVTGAEAAAKVDELLKSNADKDSELDTLRKQLAAFQNGGGTAPVIPAAPVEPINEPLNGDSSADNIEKKADAQPIAASIPAAEPVKEIPKPTAKAVEKKADAKK